MSGVVVWLTGLPSSGKSRLASHVHTALQEVDVPSCVLDGDAVRDVMKPRPGYDATARADFYASLGGLAALLARQGLVVLVPATANRRAFREQARQWAPRFMEIYVDVPLEVCAARDAKGLYAQSRDGNVEDVPGVGASYEPPEAPDVTANGGDDVAARARIVALIREGRRAK